MTQTANMTESAKPATEAISEKFSDNQPKQDDEYIREPFIGADGKQWTRVYPNPNKERIVDAKGNEKLVDKGKYGRGRPPVCRASISGCTRGLDEGSRRSQVNDLYLFWAERALMKTGDGYESRFAFLLGRGKSYDRRRPGQKRTILYELGRLIAAGFVDDAMELADEICKQRAPTTGWAATLRAIRLYLTD